MPFSDTDLSNMFIISKRLCPGVVNSIQLYYPEIDLRVGCQIGIQNKKREWICIFQNFEGLSPARMKLLHKMNNRIPYELFITYPAEGIVRIGWKC